MLVEKDMKHFRFNALKRLKYKTIAADPRLAGMISTCKAAYRAAYKAAGAVAAGT